MAEKILNLIREYKIVIGRHESIIREIEQEGTGQGITEDFLTQTIKALEITGLHVEIDIQATRKVKPGESAPAICKIYNLSSETRGKISVEDYIHIYGGYRDTDAELPLLFAGRVLEVKSALNKSGDMITTILGSVAPAALTSITVKGTMEEDIYYRDAIRRILNIIAAYGIPVGDFDDYSENSFLVNNTRLPNGFTYDGKLADVLATLCEAVNYRVYMSVGKLYVRPREIIGGTVAKYRKTVLTPDLLKGVAEPAKGTVGSSTQSKDKKIKATVTTFLNGAITPDKLVELRGYEGYTNLTDGDYMVDDIKHKLQYEGEAWDTILELSLL